MKSYLCMMAIRLLELRRVLAPTGSIYLHCDPTASHYLKLLMDAIFGRGNFRNEVVWHYRRWTGKAKRFQRLHDVVFFYTKSDKYHFNVLYTDYTTGSRQRKEQGVLHRFKQGDEPVLVSVGSVDKKGVPENDVWHIPFIAPSAKERIGYPTQKPIALLNRIIAASSNPGDVVIDPFCGCATALVAAENLTRQWVGIDISPLAVKLVRDRLKREVPLFTQNAIDRTDVPVRTDLVDEVREYLNEKRALYGQQEGRCAGCRVHFELRNMEVDHVISRVKGGPNHISNYQLLCGSCNRRKGAGSQAELIAKLKRDGIIAA